MFTYLLTYCVLSSRAWDKLSSYNNGTHVPLAGTDHTFSVDGKDSKLTIFDDGYKDVPVRLCPR